MSPCLLPRRPNLCIDFPGLNTQKLRKYNVDRSTYTLRILSDSSFVSTERQREREEEREEGREREREGGRERGREEEREGEGEGEKR